MALTRQDLQSPNRDASRERRRKMLENAISAEDLPEAELATFLLEQEIQPTVGHEPRSIIRVRTG